MAGNFLSTVLRPELIKMNLVARDKDAVIRELIDILDSQGLLKNRDEAEKVVFDREKVMSTGMENGIAIPHGKAESVDELVVALGFVPEGMDFACADGEPAKIFILTLSSASKSGPHIRFMAEVSTLLRDESLRTQLLEAGSAEDVVTLLTEGSR